MMSRAPIMVESLSAEELSALALHDQVLALNEVLSHVGIVGRELQKARYALADAKKAVLLCSDPSKKDTLKAAVIDAQLIVTHLTDRSKTLRAFTGILQTLIRAGSP